MLIKRDGYLEIPLPHLESVVQTIRASVYGNSARAAIEMRFRKSSLYDLLKGRSASSTSDRNDALMLINLWAEKPSYLDYCISLGGRDSVVTLYPTQSTLDAASDFLEKYIPESYDLFACNANIVGAMVDALGFTTARAVYFGSQSNDFTARDIVNAKTLGLTVEEIDCYKANGVTVTEPLRIKEAYSEIKKATGSIDSIVYSAANIPVRLAVKSIENNMRFSTFMEILSGDNAVVELRIILDYDLDPFLIQIIKNPESFGIATGGYTSLSLSKAA